MDTEGVEILQALSTQHNKLIRKVIENSNTHFNPVEFGDFKESVDEIHGNSLDSRNFFDLLLDLRNLGNGTSHQVVWLDERIKIQIATIERRIHKLGLIERSGNFANDQEDSFHKLLCGILQS